MSTRNLKFRSVVPARRSGLRWLGNPTLSDSNHKISDWSTMDSFLPANCRENRLFRRTFLVANESVWSRRGISWRNFSISFAKRMMEFQFLLFGCPATVEFLWLTGAKKTSSVSGFWISIRARFNKFWLSWYAPVWQGNPDSWHWQQGFLLFHLS